MVWGRGRYARTEGHDRNLNVTVLVLVGSVANADPAGYRRGARIDVEERTALSSDVTISANLRERGQAP